jgi:hypothetical protein
MAMTPVPVFAEFTTTGGKMVLDFEDCQLIGEWGWSKVEKPPTGNSLVPYSQRDPRWSSIEIYPGYTLGGVGCLITCVSMVASLAGYDDTPDEVLSNLKTAGAMRAQYLAHPEKIPSAYKNLEWLGARDWRKKAADLDNLKDLLSYGPVIIEVEFKPGGDPPPTDQHFVLAKGFTENDQDLEIIDPWDGAETRLLERYALSQWNLKRAIYGARLLFVVGG